MDGDDGLIEIDEGVDATEEINAELSALRAFIGAAKRGAAIPLPRRPSVQLSSDDDKENAVVRRDATAKVETRPAPGGVKFGTAPAHSGGKNVTVVPGRSTAEDDRMLNRLPWLYFAAEKAHSVMNPSSKAEREARDMARKRLMELLGPELGATPETVGASHIPRPLRLKRLAEQEALSRGGPGSYTLSEMVQAPYFNARVANTRGGCLVFGPPKDAQGNAVARKTKNGKTEAAPAALPIRQKARRMGSSRALPSFVKAPATVHYREVLLVDLAEQEQEQELYAQREDAGDEEEIAAESVARDWSADGTPQPGEQQSITTIGDENENGEAADSKSASNDSSGWGSEDSSWYDDDSSSGFSSSSGSDDDEAAPEEAAADGGADDRGGQITATEAEQLLESLAAAIAHHQKQLAPKPLPPPSKQPNAGDDSQKRIHEVPAAAVAGTPPAPAPQVAQQSRRPPPVTVEAIAPAPPAVLQQRDPRDILRRALEALPEKDRKAVALLLLRVRQMAAHKASLKLLKLDALRWEATHRKSFRGSTSFSKSARSGTGPVEAGTGAAGAGHEAAPSSRKALAEVRFKSKLRYARLENEQRKQERDQWFARERGLQPDRVDDDAMAQASSSASQGNAQALFDKARLRLRKALVALEVLQRQQQQQQRPTVAPAVDVRDMLLSSQLEGSSQESSSAAKHKRRHSVAGTNASDVLSALSTTPFIGRAAVDWGASARAERFSAEASKRKAVLRGLLLTGAAADGNEESELLRLVAKRSRSAGGRRDAVDYEVEAFVENRVLEAKLVQAARLQIPPQQQWYSSQLHPEYVNGARAGKSKAKADMGRQGKPPAINTAGGADEVVAGEGDVLDWVRTVRGQDAGSADDLRRRQLHQERQRQAEERAQASSRLPTVFVSGTTVFMGSKTPRFPLDKGESEMEAVFTHVDPDTGLIHKRATPSSENFRRLTLSESKWSDSKSAYTSASEGDQQERGRTQRNDSRSASRSRSRSRSRVSYSRMTGRDDAYDPFGRPPDTRLLTEGQASERLKEKLLRAKLQRRKDRRRRKQELAAGDRASVGTADDGKEAGDSSDDDDIALSFLNSAGARAGGMVLNPRDDFVSTNPRLVYGRSFGKAERFEGEDANAAAGNGDAKKEALLMSQLAKALDLALPPGFSLAEGGGRAGRDILALDPAAADAVTRKARKGQRFAAFGKMAGREAKVSGDAAKAADADEREALADYFSNAYGVAASAGNEGAALALDYGAMLRAVNGGRAIGRGLYVDIAKRFNPRSNDDGEISSQTLMRLLSRYAAKQAGAAANALKQNHSAGAPAHSNSTSLAANEPETNQLGFEALELLAEKLMEGGGSSSLAAGDSVLVTNPQKPSRAVRPRNLHLRKQRTREDDDKQAPKLKKLRNQRVQEHSLLALQLSEEGYQKLAEAGVSLQEYEDILFGRPSSSSSASASASASAVGYHDAQSGAIESYASAAIEQGSSALPGGAGFGAYSSVLASGYGVSSSKLLPVEPGALAFGPSAANVGAGAAAIGSSVNNRASSMARMVGREAVAAAGSGSAGDRAASAAEDEEAVRRAIEAMIIF